MNRAFLESALLWGYRQDKKRIGESLGIPLGDYLKKHADYDLVKLIIMKIDFDTLLYMYECSERRRRK